MHKSLFSLSLLAAASAPVFAADYSDGNIHKNDYSWKQFDLMYASEELPGENSHNYLEMEIGGRSGIFDLYGYLDIFNLSDSDHDDKAESPSKMFLKLQPRISLDAVTGKDLSFGPVKELYIASELTWDGANNSVDSGATNNYKVGIGSDVMVPWFGKMGLNLYATYNNYQKDWNGYQISTNWFKPFINFDNGTFIAYQGYIDWQFDMDEGSAPTGGNMFNGIYWHSKRYAVGYGLKLFKNVYGIRDSHSFKSSGASHYFSVTYKF